jgi:glycosyltransferase involved in cell wall biosynthesis
MTISVVIATYNRARRLDACLRQLERQAFEPGDEVVVANNGSTDDTAAVLREAADRMPMLRIVEETRPGKSAAVAAALRDCRADVLAFTDDDVLVANDWLAAIRAVMQDETVALAGGPVLPLCERRTPDWLDLGGVDGYGRLAAPLALLHYGQQRVPLGPRVVLGANMTVRRRDFISAGGFPTDLGKLRGTLLSGEDHELCERVRAAGGVTIYDPSLRVRHLVPADRLRLSYFLRWFFWSGLTHAAMDRVRREPGTERRLLGVPAFVVRQFGVAAAMTATSLLRASWAHAVDHGTEAAFAAGYAWARWTRRGRQRTPAMPPGRRAEAA